MIIRILFYTCCFCLISFGLHASEKNRLADLEAEIGLSIHSILDDGYAAFTFNSVNPVYAFSFERDKNTNRIGFGLDAVIGSTNYNDYALFKTTLIDFELYALYARKIGLKSEQSDIYLGPVLDYDILFLLNMDDEFQVGNVSYTVALSLGLYAGLDHEFSEKNELSAAFQLPLLTSVVRNPYTGYNQTTTLLTDYGDNLPPLIFHNPEITHGFDFFRPRIDLKWKYQLTDKLKLAPAAGIEYLSYNAINPIKYFRSDLSIALIF